MQDSLGLSVCIYQAWEAPPGTHWLCPFPGDVSLSLKVLECLGPPDVPCTSLLPCYLRRELQKLHLPSSFHDQVLIAWPCLSLLSVAVRKHHDLKQLGEGQVYYSFQSIMKKSQGENSRQELKQKPWNAALLASSWDGHHGPFSTVLAGVPTAGWTPAVCGWVVLY